MINRLENSTLKMISLFIMVISLFANLPSSYAQDDEPRRSTAPSLSSTVAVAVQEALNFSQEDPPRTDAAINRLNKLISDRGDRLQGYDKATVYEVRGSFYANKDDLRSALRDFQTAVDTGALPEERSNGLRYFIAQIYFQLERYDDAIRGLNAWLRTAGDNPPANAYYLLALAYIQKDDFRNAQQPMERALRIKNAEAGSQPDKNYYSALNLVYSENNEFNKRADLLERMINIWPNEAGYWAQLAGAYAVNKRDRDAFSVLEAAYRAGLLEKEEQIIQLIQYYSFFDNAYRGAQLLDREMAAGVVKRDRDNLILLSQLWDQSREAKKAIPILREAAGSTNKGDLHYRLGRVLVADEQFVDAEKELLTAIRKGGLKTKDIAQIWMLLGNARFAQAGPEDIRQFNRAKEAFQNATRYPSTRRDANDWVTYINELIRVQRVTKDREIAEQKAICDDNLERLDDAKRVLVLQGRDPLDITENLANALETCGYDKAGEVIPGGIADKAEAAPAAEEAAPAQE